MKKISDVYRLVEALMYPFWDEDERNTIHTFTDEYFENRDKIHQEFKSIVGKENAWNILFESNSENYKKIVKKYLHNK